MERFIKEITGIYRLCVPFERIYTSVFLIESKSGAILVDCATTDSDVEQVIFPALGEIGYSFSDVNALIVTHRHGDHAGGLARVCRYAPDIKVITGDGAVDEDIEVIAMVGHSDDSVGIFDRRTGTLISGDSLQGAGVDKYRCLVKNKEAYFETLERVKGDERIENILFSHAYEPWNKSSIFGRAAVLDCIEECKKYI